MMYLYLEDIGYFQIQEPEIVNDGNYEYKEVTAYSIEKEFEQKDWLNLRINTGDPDSLEQLATDNLNELGFAKEFVTFYNPENAELSFVDLMLTKMPGWTIGHIDSRLYYSVVPRIDIDNSNLYAIMTTEVAPRMSCIFIFDFLHKQVNAYHQSDIDFDTNIFIGFRNLAQEVEISVDEDSVFTEFRVRGDGELSCRNANFGSDQVFDLSYFIGKPWMSDETAEKVRAWIGYRDEQRSVYTDLAREAATINEQLYGLKYRVPSDPTYWKQWDNMNEEGLRENLKVYQAQLQLLQVSVDDRPDSEKYDESGNYLPKMSGDEVDNDWYLERLYESANGYGGYYTYKEIITYIIPYIETAIDNLNKLPEDKTKYGDESAENWSLYGYIELDAKRKNYEEDKLPALDKFKLPWSELTDEQKTAYVDETGYNAAGRSLYEHVYHELYGEPVDNLVTIDTSVIDGDAVIVDERGTPGCIYYYLAVLREQIESLEEKLEAVEYTMGEISKNVSLESSLFGFTEAEQKLIHTLLVDTDYTNSNILTTSIDTVITTIDHEVELYEDAVDKLSEVAQPQFSFKVDLDNLLRIPQFNGWVEDLRLLRFIRLGIRDDYSVKLRVVGIKYNPCEITPDLELEFSSMITSKSGRSDFTDIIMNSKNRGSKNSISLGTGNSSNESEYLTSLLTMLTQSGIFKGAVTNIASGVTTNLDTTAVNNIISAYLQNTTVSADHITGDLDISLSADSIATKLLEADKAIMDEVFVTYMDADTIIASLIDADVGEFNELSAKILDADTGKFGELMADYLQADRGVIAEQISANSYIKQQVIGDLSVADLKAGDIVLSDSMRIISENGNLVMNGNALQIIGKDENEHDYVGVQLGYDSTGNPSLILRNSDGTTVLTPEGITSDAIADELIINNMIATGTISQDKLNFDVWSKDDKITIENIYTQTGDVFGAEWINFKDEVGQIGDIVDGTIIQVTPIYLRSQYSDVDDIMSHNPPGMPRTNLASAEGTLTLSDGAFYSGTTDWSYIRPLWTSETQTDKYIWMSNEIIRADGTVEYTTPVCDNTWQSTQTTISGVSTIVDNLKESITNKVWQTDINTALENFTANGQNLFDINNVRSYRNGTLYDATNIVISGTSVLVNGNPNIYPGLKADVSRVSVNQGQKVIVVDGYYQYQTPGDPDEFSNVVVAYRPFDSNDQPLQAQATIPVSFDSSADVTTNRFKAFITLSGNSVNADYINVGIGQAYSEPYILESVVIKDAMVYDTATSIRDRLSQQVIDIEGIHTTVSELDSDIENGELIKKLATQDFTVDGVTTNISAMNTLLGETSTTTTQTADKISLIVKDGSTSSSVELTPAAMNFVSTNINLAGNAVFQSLTTTEEGVTVIDGSKISTGSIDADSLNVINLSTISANIGQINAGSLQSADYAYTSGNFADAGMKIDLDNKYIRSMNFAVNQNGDAYLNNAHLSGNLTASSVTLKDSQNTTFATLNTDGLNVSRGSINLANHFVVDTDGHTTITFAQGDTNVTDAFTVQKSNGQGVAPTKYIYVDSQGNLKINGDTIQLTAGSLTSKLTTLEQNDTALTTKITNGDSTTMTHAYGDGVLIGKNNQNVCALVNANGSFDIVNVVWTNGVPQVQSTSASFGQNTNSIAPKLAVCQTIGATADKVATCSGFTLYTGAIVHVRFAHANDADGTELAPVSLNVNSTGAYPIYANGARITSSFKPWNDGETVTLGFDGTVWNIIGQMNINADNITTGTLNAVTVNAQNGSNIAGWIVDSNSAESSFRSPWETADPDTQNAFDYQTVFKSTADSSHGVLFIKNKAVGGNENTATYPFTVKPNGSVFSTNPVFQWNYGSKNSDNKYKYTQLRQAGNDTQGFTLSIAEYNESGTPQQFYNLIDKDGNFLPNYVTKADMALTAIDVTLAPNIGTLYKNRSFKYGPLVYINVQINGVSVTKNTNTTLFYISKDYAPSTTSGEFVLLSGVYANSTFMHTWVGKYTVNNTEQTWVYCRNDNERVDNELVIVQGLYYIP